jgi:HD-like signal output (HDOD) protein
MDKVSLNRELEHYIAHMPSMPSTVVKVIELANDPHTSPTDLNRVISMDPVLMGNVLKLVNSSYYGLPEKITSLVHAIIMLGINTVKNLALSSAVLAIMNRKNEKSAIDLDQFWIHSLSSGVICKLIARLRGIPAKQQEEYMIAGLLHDIGKLPLSAIMPDVYRRVIDLSLEEKRPLFQLEKQYLDITHMDVGAMVIRFWKLPDELVDVTLWHHDPAGYDGRFQEYVYSAHVADFYSIRCRQGDAGNCWFEDIPQKVWDYLGLRPEQMEAMTNEANHEIENAKVFLKLVSGEGL